MLGYGVFETVHLRPSGPWLLDEHLARLARSAALLDMPVPALEDLHHTATPEGALRILCPADAPARITVSDIPDTIRAERRTGIRVLTTEAGVSLKRPTWSLTGAKTLSYAPNLAARRWAHRQGADDLIWFSTEGYALEAPTASVVWLTGSHVHTVSPAEASILPGITAAHLLDRAPALGLTATERLITRDELHQADAVWLVSSLRGLAEVIELDGTPRPRSPWTPRLLALLGFDQPSGPPQDSSRH